MCGVAAEGRQTEFGARFHLGGGKGKIGIDSTTFQNCTVIPFGIFLPLPSVRIINSDMARNGAPLIGGWPFEPLGDSSFFS